jgi:LysR family hydrogen peroxide-inducible transcriptional activator
MDVRQLAALVAVAENGTFSAAADALHTVQSNVSTHVARLERELGVTLVDRAGARLTEEGELVVERARRIQAELEAITADVASLHDHVAGTVRLGMLGTTGRWLVPPMLRAMEATHPNVQVAVLEGNTTSLVPQLLNNRLDVAVVNLPIDDPDLVVESLFEEDLIAVVPSGHPFAEADELTVEDLAAEPILMPPPGAAYRNELDRLAAEAGVTLRPRAELDGLRLTASMAMDGYGAAVLPSSAVPGWLTGDFQRIPITGVPRRRVGLARRRRGLPSAPTRALVEVVREQVTALAPGVPGLHPSA